MKNTIIFLALCFFIVNAIKANNEPVVVMKTNGEKEEVANMYPIVEGAVKLFYEPDDIVVFDDRDEQENTTIATLKVNLFYIGTSKQVEQINSGNYKRLVKKYLPHAYDLHQRLGKRGFRFENLPSMLLYYNRKVNRKNQPFIKIANLN